MRENRGRTSGGSWSRRGQGGRRGANTLVAWGVLGPLQSKPCVYTDGAGVRCAASRKQRYGGGADLCSCAKPPPFPRSLLSALREACQAHCVPPAATCNPTYCAVTWSTSWDAVIALWVGAVGAGRVAKTAQEDACRLPDPPAAQPCLTESAYHVLAICSRENVQIYRIGRLRLSAQRHPESPSRRQPPVLTRKLPYRRSID
jgi:hypothetical protein